MFSTRYRETPYALLRLYGFTNEPRSRLRERSSSICSRLSRYLEAISRSGSAVSCPSKWCAPNARPTTHNNQWCYGRPDRPTCFLVGYLGVFLTLSKDLPRTSVCCVAIYIIDLYTCRLCQPERIFSCLYQFLNIMFVINQLCFSATGSIGGRTYYF